MYLVQAQRKTKLANIFLLMFKLNHVTDYFNALTVNIREIDFNISINPSF